MIESASAGGGGGGMGAAPTVVVRVSPEGNVTKALEGFSFVSMSEVAERRGTIWVGSVDTPYAGELRRRRPRARNRWRRKERERNESTRKRTGGRWRMTGGA